MGTKRYNKNIALSGYLVQTIDEGDNVSICSISNKNVYTIITISNEDILFEIPLNAYFVIRGGSISLTPDGKLVSKAYKKTKFKFQLMLHSNFESVKYMRRCKCALETGG